jgi:hypothetical protein
VAEASRILARVADTARHGDYLTAMRELDGAEVVAPRYAAVFQYRSSLAYLMGDLPRAVSDLQRALEIEPQNALFRQSLEELQRRMTSGP